MTVEKEFHNMTFKGDTMYFPRDEYTRVSFTDCNIEDLTLENVASAEFERCNIKKLDFMNCFGVEISNSSLDCVAFYETASLVTVDNSKIDDLYFEEDYNYETTDLMLDESDVVFSYVGRCVNVTADKLSSISGNIDKTFVSFYSYEE